MKSDTFSSTNKSVTRYLVCFAALLRMRSAPKSLSSLVKLVYPKCPEVKEKDFFSSKFANFIELRSRCTFSSITRKHCYPLCKKNTILFNFVILWPCWERSSKSADNIYGTLGTFFSLWYNTKVLPRALQGALENVAADLVAPNF